MAENSTLQIVARLLWAFDILPGLDAAGREIRNTADINTDYENSAISSAKPFPVRLRLRDPKRGEVIRAAFEDALEIWEKEDWDLFRD